MTDPATDFVAQHIRTLDELQLLVTMASAEDRWWDATTVARELRITTKAARRALEHLAAHNLLEIRVTDDIRYQFRPGTVELENAAHACVDAYQMNPLAVVRILSDTDRRGMRDFADAFRIRKK